MTREPLHLADYDYALPEERIAQEPLPRRDASRLLVLDRDTGAVTHRGVTDFPDLLAPGDLVVVNDTRVVPARLVGRRAGGGRTEILLLSRVRSRAGMGTGTGAGAGEGRGAGEGSASPFGEEGDRVQVWEALLGRGPAAGGRIALDEGVEAVVLSRRGETAEVRLVRAAGGLDGALARLGRVPLPPYVRRTADDPRGALDRERYQTVYAREPGSSAAPTAGLHFTPALLERLGERGVARAEVTLHVGAGTFLPFRTDPVPEDHRLHEEAYAIPEAAAEAVAAARARGGRVVAVGTTVCRTLEAAAGEDGTVRAGEGRTRLFLRPGWRFRVVDALLTNFHLPRSSLLVLVCAFAGRDRVLRAYREAVAAGYRFYSYGDAMLVRSGG